MCIDLHDLRRCACYAAALRTNCRRNHGVGMAMAYSERCVLVVDDDKDVRDLLSRALADAGNDVRAAASGHEALELLRDCRPRLILLT